MHKILTSLEKVEKFTLNRILSHHLRFTRKRSRACFVATYQITSKASQIETQIQVETALKCDLTPDIWHSPCSHIHQGLSTGSRGHAMFKRIKSLNTTGSRLLLAVTAAALLSGCGSNMRPRDGALLAASASSSAFGAECNQFSATGLTLSGRASAVYTNGSQQEDRTRLRITSIASEFSQSTSMTIRFFRWTVDANGNPNLDQQPLSFVVERASSFGLASTPISNTINALTLNDINSLAWSGGIYATTVQDFFNNVNIVVLGTDYSWSALKVALYNGSEVVAQADMLLPIFAANPNAYAVIHHPILNSLHPFWAQRADSGVSDADWVARSKNYCF